MTLSFSSSFTSLQYVRPSKIRASTSTRVADPNVRLTKTAAWVYGTGSLPNHFGQEGHGVSQAAAFYHSPKKLVKQNYVIDFRYPRQPERRPQARGSQCPEKPGRSAPGNGAEISRGWPGETGR